MHVFRDNITVARSHIGRYDCTSRLTVTNNGPMGIAPIGLSKGPRMVAFIGRQTRVGKHFDAENVGAYLQFSTSNFPLTLVGMHYK